MKVDTGMGRYGFMPHETEKILSVYLHNDNLAVSGIYTLSTPPFVMKIPSLPRPRPSRASSMPSSRPGWIPARHTAAIPRPSSAGRSSTWAASRLGSALLGRVLVKQTSGGWGAARPRWMKSAGSPPAHSTGYGAAWKAKKPTRTAVIPVGWYHGFAVSYGDDIFRIRDCIRAMLRALKNMLRRKKLYVRIIGSLCPVLGHVGMLHTVCDITKANCSVGDTAFWTSTPSRCAAWRSVSVA